MDGWAFVIWLCHRLAIAACVLVFYFSLVFDCFVLSICL